MSWPQRAGGAAPAQLQRQPQGFNNQQNMYPNYQGAPPPQSNTQPQQQQQQQYWQNQQPQYNQQYGQAYPQQDYGSNANQMYQGQYNQTYANQGYANTQQQYQQNYYQNQGGQQPGYPAQAKTDSWEDNWDWGWDDAAKQAQQAQNQAATQQLPAQPPQQQQQGFNNANVIEESFASTNTWNWSMEDKKDANQPTPVTNTEPKPAEVLRESITVSETPSSRSASNLSAHATTEEVKTLSDRDVVKEKLPNLALGKRFHLDNLTPQWSIESQMSQESSDGPQTHSEGTYRSDNQSRNSSKSSPGLNTENSNFNYSQSALEEFTPSKEWSHQSTDEGTRTESAQSGRRESHDDLPKSLQDLSISNRENPAPEPTAASVPPSVSPANLPPPVSSFMNPPSSLPAPTMPPAPPVTAGSHPPTLSAAGLPPPPTNFPQSSSSNTNPFKQTGSFTHIKPPSASPSSTNLVSPNVVSKASQHRLPVGFGANLETTPDNSERPDQPQISAFRPMPVTQQVPDNLEVAPQNDRNEYLQTAHLSSGDYGENTDFSRHAPPPGLRRMVVGQQESEYGQNLNMTGDEPPPGLSRMVPGQQTEANTTYNQPDNYMERHIDGQPTETGSSRPYRQADGQQTPDYSQPPSRGSERRPIGLDRMVPGEPSNDEFPQYQVGNYTANDQRVVTGVDHDYPLQSDAGPTDVREQNVDGSDYSEQTPRSAQRNVIGAREVTNDVSQDYNPIPDEHQREVTMEGENLQDLSTISSVEMSFSREQPLDGADVNATDVATDRKTDLSDSIEHAVSSSRRQSLNRINTSGEESERDRAFKSSPRRDRDKHKSSRDHDRDKDRSKDDRYSRGERKYDREGEKRRDRGDRERDWEREDSPQSRRHRRSNRSRRYETEDTDYYSDKERERRAYREGSYASKPPRPDDKDRRDRDRDRSRRYNTIERDRRIDEDRRRDRDRDRHRSMRDRDREPRDRYEARYRDIDPSRKHGNLRAQREDEDRRRVTFTSETKANTSKQGDVYSSASRAESRDAPATDEDLHDGAEPRRRDRRDRRDRRERDRERNDPYYDKYGGGYTDAYELQRQQYAYYEQLRVSDPHAYLLVYKQLMAGRTPPLPPNLTAKHSYAHMYGYETRTEDRGSVHSGRSSTNGLKGNDTYYLSGGMRLDQSSLRDAPSLRTDLSDRELNTDASLNLHLEESTVRSERMTPFKFSTAHIKGSISSRDVVVVRPSYPVDGLPATVQLLALAAAAPAPALAAYPGPLTRGVTHKKSVIEYCMSRVRSASSSAPRDVIGYVLVWELLALLLRQNGVVVGSDIAELLMKNTKEYEYKVPSAKNSTNNGSRRGSSLSGRDDERSWTPEQPSLSTSELTAQEETNAPQPAVDERAALARLRDYLIYGNRQDALEWAMSCGLWGHALTLAESMDRRWRTLAAARFLAALPRKDPLHSLYAHLAAKPVPAAACVTDERWGDWRPHAAIVLSNTSTKPGHDQRTLIQLADSLSSRGLLYSSQFCLVCAGAAISRHPLAPLQPPPAPTSPPRLSLLLGDPRAHTLDQLATDHAIFATEIYEYALSLNQDYVINDLQIYKFLLAVRLIDCGQYERALSYLEAASRGVLAAPEAHSAAFIRQLANLGHRLQYHDPALQDGQELEEGHMQWLKDIMNLADLRMNEAAQSHPPVQSHEGTPQHEYYNQPAPVPAPAPVPMIPTAVPAHTQQQPVWGEQTPQHQPYQQVNQTYEAEEAVDYSHYYQQQAPVQDPPQEAQPGGDHDPPLGEDWAAHYADNYWQGDQTYSYGEQTHSAPQISMPGTVRTQRQASTEDEDEDASNNQQEGTQTPQGQTQDKKPRGKEETKAGGAGGKGWLGGILTKLSLRPPNQMILPDDKNPSIVWDEEHKRWRNVDGDDDANDAPPPPPPTMNDLRQNLGSPQSAPAGAAPPPAAPMSNIFKMQKGRHIKKSYVDVFNPGGAARALPPAAEVLGPAAAMAPPPANYFIPASQPGIYDPNQAESEDAVRHSGI